MPPKGTRGEPSHGSHTKVQPLRVTGDQGETKGVIQDDKSAAATSGPLLTAHWA
eukprot:COSAG02_NODE_39180_length_420_cov_0.794393_1_plen_53_part_01